MDIANPDAFPYLNYPMASMEDLAETKRLVEEQGSRYIQGKLLGCWNIIFHIDYYLQGQKLNHTADLNKR